MADRALPDLKSKITVDSSSLKKVEAEAAASGSGISLGMGKGSAAAKNLGKDLEDVGKKSAGSIPFIGGLGSSMGGLPLPALAAAAAVGGLVMAGKGMVDISEKWEVSQKGLKQATDSAGASYSDAQDEVNSFIATNKRFIPNQAEVVDSFAALTRQLGANGNVTQDVNLALDLSAIKHISLKDATTALQGAEAGRGKALIALGINMKDFPVLAESQSQADKKLEAATKAAEKATVAHTAAVKAHGATSLQAKAAAAALADANAKLADAHAYTAKRAAASAEIHDLLSQKLKGGRETTSDLKQTQNELSNTFQTFAERVGPVLLAMLDGLEKVLLTVIQAILNAIDVMATWHGLWDIVGKVIGVVATIVKDEFMVALAIAKVEISAVVDVVTILWTAFTKVVSAVQDVIHFLGQIKVPSINLPFGIGGPSGSPQKHATGGFASYTGLHQLEQGELVLNRQQQVSAGVGGNVTLHVHGFVGNPNELFKVFREGIRRQDAAQR